MRRPSHASPRAAAFPTCQLIGGDRRDEAPQRWSTFLKNHARAIVACDFFVTVTATFQLVYVLVVIEHGSRRLLHMNTTRHPTSAWTFQQLREVVGLETTHRYLLHDRDSIFAKSLDQSIANLGLKVLKSPPESPKANSICERVIGTIRRECLDWLIPISEPHLRAILRIWGSHYNHSRPHMALGPGVPAPLLRIHGIVSPRDCVSVPNPCWAGYTMSTHS